MTGGQQALLQADVAARCAQRALLEAIDILTAEMKRSGELNTDLAKSARDHLGVIKDEIASVRRALNDGAR